MPWDKSSRLDEVAKAILNAEYDGHVTYESMNKRYGTEEAEKMVIQYRAKARAFLAAYDVARMFDNRLPIDSAPVQE